MWPGFEKEKVLISGHAKRRQAGLDGNSREVSEGWIWAGEISTVHQDAEPI